MAPKVKRGQAADVADALHPHCVVAHKLQDGAWGLQIGERIMQRWALLGLVGGGVLMKAMKPKGRLRAKRA